MTQPYVIYYYIAPSGDNPVSDFFDSLNERQQTKILRIIQYVKEYGLSSILPHTKKVAGTPLWEIRILGRDNIRVLYAIPINKIVLILHGFLKKLKRLRKKNYKLRLSDMNIGEKFTVLTNDIF